MDLAAATVRNELVKRCDSVPTEGWAGTGSSPLTQTPGAADRNVVFILLLRMIILPATELRLASLTSNLRKKT